VRHRGEKGLALGLVVVEEEEEEEEGTEEGMSRL